MTIYISRNHVEIRSLATLVCFVTIWCKQFQGLSPSKRNGRGFTTNSAGVTKRRSQVDIFLVVSAGPRGSPRGTGARPRGWARPPPSWGPWDSPPVTLRSSIFLYFPEKISVDFQRIPRTFISAQKHHHGSSIENSVSRVSSNQIKRKSCKNIVNMA